MAFLLERSILLGRTSASHLVQVVGLGHVVEHGGHGRRRVRYVLSQRVVSLASDAAVSSSARKHLVEAGRLTVHHFFGDWPSVSVLGLGIRARSGGRLLQLLLELPSVVGSRSEHKARLAGGLVDRVPRTEESASMIMSLLLTRRALARYSVAMRCYVVVHAVSRLLHKRSVLRLVANVITVMF